MFFTKSWKKKAKFNLSLHPDDIFYSPTNKEMNQRKLLLFIVLAFAISWTIIGIQYFAGIDPGGVLGKMVFGGLFMWGPAIAAIIIQKLIYKEPLAEYGFTIQKTDWKWVLVSVLTPIVAILLTFFTIYLLGNLAGISGFGKFSLAEADLVSNIKQTLIDAGQQESADAFNELPYSPGWVFLSISLLGGLIGGITINLIYAYGEEQGWRGLMLMETRHLGFWKANLLIGAVWGLWHAPMILQGLNYPDYPYLGSLIMVGFCISASLPMAYLSFKSKSIIAPAAFHGVLNGVGGNIIIFVSEADSALGNIAGVAGMIALTGIGLFFILRDKTFLEEYQNLFYVEEKSDIEEITAI